VIPVDSDSSAKAPSDGATSSTADKGPPTNAATPSDATADSPDAGNTASNPSASTKKNANNKARDSDADNDEDANNSEDAESAPAAKPIPAQAKPPAAKPVDVVTQAEKYIYGRGVPQDCDRGVKMVRQAANQSNAKAMISLGALYSAGLCTPRDLPTAYRWFALALHKDPDNNSLQTDLNKLWSEMTPPERQLAIKLSQ
jgi:TPR repeat protein